MKKILLILTLAFLNTSVLAEWTRIGAHENENGYAAYADFTSVRTAGDRVKMWVLFDYQTEQRASGASFLSKTIRREYDCKGKHMRLLAFKLFRWNMGGGEQLRAYNQPQNWESVVPESMGEAEWKAACS